MSKNYFGGRFQAVPVTIDEDIYKQYLAELAEILYQFFQKNEKAFFDLETETPRPSEGKEDRS